MGFRRGDCPPLRNEARLRRGWFASSAVIGPAALRASNARMLTDLLGIGVLPLDPSVN